jgi:hypothetical protein
MDPFDCLEEYESFLLKRNGDALLKYWEEKESEHVMEQIYENNENNFRKFS